MRIVLLVLLCFVVAACGSGAKGLSKEEYARRADAICARYRHAAAAQPIPATTPAVAKAATQTLRLLDTATKRLRALPVPHGEEQLAKEWLASLATLRRDVVRLRDRARANDLAGIRALVAPARRHDHASLQLAARLGMKICSTEIG